MDRSKWILAIGIVAMMLAVGISVPVDDSEATDQEVDTTWYTSYSSPFHIKDVADLLGLARIVNEGLQEDNDTQATVHNFENETIYLDASLDLSKVSSWTPIGNGVRNDSSFTGNSFKGTFYGNGYTISGLNIQTTLTETGKIQGGKDTAEGLFGVVSGGTIENLKLTNVNITVTKGA